MESEFADPALHRVTAPGIRTFLGQTCLDQKGVKLRRQSTGLAIGLFALAMGIGKYLIARAPLLRP